MSAKAQLIYYRDWFRERANRRKLKDVVGMEIYEPKLIVVIRRASDFHNEFERQQLAADNHDLEGVTYDDLMTFAQYRRVFVEKY
jgi:hypothetical protein